MVFVDGFVLVVPKKKVKEYVKMASAASKIWMKYGALQYVEAMGDDLKPNTPGAKILTFPKLAKMKGNETVWFSFIVYKSKEHRNAVNKKVMKDPGMKDMPCTPETMPFDFKRMAFGGFKAVVEK